MPNIRIHYDELWKDAMENLFQCFIKLIAPDFYPHVNWSKPISFLDQELHQISPKSEETKRFVDRLVRVWMLNGEERWVLVHVEVQGYRKPKASVNEVNRETEFSRRMFIYFYRIYDKFNRDILSISVFADPSEGFKPDRFNYEFFGCELSFRYRTYKILEQDDKALEASDNPFALVVLAAKRNLQSREDEEKRFSFKRELIRLMLDKGYRREEILHVFRFLDGVLALTNLEKEKIIYDEFMGKEVEKVAYITNFERLAMLRVARELVLDALEVKFGAVSKDIFGKVEKIQEREVLRQLHRQAIIASSLEEFNKSLQG